MMTELTLTLLIFLFPLAYSPGPGNLFFAANGARFGFMPTWPANLGYHLATFLVTALIGLCFLKGATALPAALQLLTYAGSAYILWLAWALFNAGEATGMQARPAGFRDGALLLLLNPKAYLIIFLMFTQFTQADLPPVESTGRVLWISVVFTGNNLIAFCLAAYAGDRLTRRRRALGFTQWQNRFFGILLAAVAIWLLWG